jgi:hypothetical protein
MKLAEGLLLRADLQKKLNSLRERVVQNALVQEGDVARENPQTLMAEAEEVIVQLQALVAKINRCNLANKIADGRTITDALAQRDSLAQRHALITAAIGGVNKDQERYSMREIKWVPTLDVPALQKQLEALAREIRELNTRLQEANWSVALD